MLKETAVADENFFSRWSRRKAEVTREKQAPELAQPEAPAAVPAAPPAQAAQPAPRTAPGQPATAQDKPALTLEDVAQLTPESDFSAFVARGVDEGVRRAAMKKLFANPHFNVMDGLDVYIDDYNKFEPIPAAMLASLEHAKGVLNPLGQLEKPLAMLKETIEQDEETSTEEDAVEAAQASADADAEAATDPTPEAGETGQEGDADAPPQPDTPQQHITRS